VRLQRGDEWAFQLLVRRYRKKIFSIAFGITVDAEESKDIVQEVFLQVYQRIGNFRSDASLSTWLHRITVNRCLNWKRRWTRRFKWMHVTVPTAPMMKHGERTLKAICPHRKAGWREHRPDSRLTMPSSCSRTRPEQSSFSENWKAFPTKRLPMATNIKLGTVRSRLCSMHASGSERSCSP
jgi:RNA polymerase sigma factor (sigma-70 family)